MDAMFCVLGSGSKGNAALLITPHLQLLVDAGFSPDELAARLAGTPASWETLDAVLLTHTHSDHIKKRCLGLFAENGVQFFCHKRHVGYFEGGRYFNKLRDKGLVWVFGSEPFQIRPKVPAPAGTDTPSRQAAEKDRQCGNWLSVPAGFSKARTSSGLRVADCGPLRPAGTDTPSRQAAEKDRPCGNWLSVPAGFLGEEGFLRVQPLPLPHDSPPTFGFRIEARIVAQASCLPAPQTERWVKLAYLADLGEFSDDLARAVAGVDLLALEFNHDEEMELNSGRPSYLIERVLGREGHLSNKQAAAALRKVLERGVNGGPKTLVQLHLSQECNAPRLAFEAAQEVVTACGAATQIFSTRQEQRGTVHVL